MTSRSIHPFPARMAPDLALDYLPELEGKQALTVLDPMCGSGTVVAAAASRGHKAVGVDIDPLAVLMSSVSTSEWSGAGLHDAAVARVVRASRLSTSVTPWPATDEATLKFAKFWFGQTQLDQLNPLSRAIGELEDGPLKRALQIALSRIIVTKSPRASLAGDTSHSRPHRIVTENDYNVWDGFLDSARQVERLLTKRTITGSASVSLGDSRNLTIVGNSTADLAITSPPYLNALDYLRGHKMSLIWMGYSIESLRRIRSESIGAERALDDEPSERVKELRNYAIGGAENPLLPIGTITRYAHDMSKFADEMRRVLKPSARLVVVVGNSHLKGSPVSNDGLTRLALEQAGFSTQSRLERVIPANKRYLPISRGYAGVSMEKRMKTEVVLSMRAPSTARL